MLASDNERQTKQSEHDEGDDNNANTGDIEGRDDRRVHFAPGPAFDDMPWNTLADAAEYCARTFERMAPKEYERSFGAVIAKFGVKPLGQEAIGEVHERGAVLLEMPPAIRRRLFATIETSRG